MHWLVVISCISQIRAANLSGDCSLLSEKFYRLNIGEKHNHKVCWWTGIITRLLFGVCCAQQSWFWCRIDIFRWTFHFPVKVPFVNIGNGEMAFHLQEGILRSADLKFCSLRDGIRGGILFFIVKGTFCEKLTFCLDKIFENVSLQRWEVRNDDYPPSLHKQHENFNILSYIQSCLATTFFCHNHLKECLIYILFLCDTCTYEEESLRHLLD